MYVQSSAVMTRSIAVRYCITIVGTQVEYQSGDKATKGTPYLAMTSEIWAVFCEYSWENWPRYNGSTLYLRGVSQYTKNYLNKRDVYIPSLRSSC